MDETTKARLRPILENSKRGKPNSKRDDDFAARCFRKWPAEYSEFRAEVVGAVVRAMNPFAN
ncbi:hypothetical protein ACUXPM_003591 [Ralstonia sp. 151470066-2]|jgi:hypothetical protein